MGSVRDGTLSAVLPARGGRKSEITSVAIGNCQASATATGSCSASRPVAANGNTEPGQWTGSFRQSCRDDPSTKHGKLQDTVARTTEPTSAVTCGAEVPQLSRRQRNGDLFCEPNGSTGGAGHWAGRSAGPVGDFDGLEWRADGHLPDDERSLEPDQPVDAGSAPAGGRQPGRHPVLRIRRQHSGAGRWDGIVQPVLPRRSTESNGVLTATCQTMSGRWNRTSLSTRQLRSRQAGNRDGTLFCEQ